MQKTPTLRDFQDSIAKGENPPVQSLVASETYLGMLACKDCQGVRTELALYEESGAGGGEAVNPAAYHLRETFIGDAGEKAVDSFGTWKEIPDLNRWGTILDLKDFKRGGDTFLTSARDNEGTLLILDNELHELPPNVPHSLARITGNRQRDIVFLSEADNGRTVELKPGEVLLLRLQANPKTRAMWTSDRPPAMALMESDTNHPSSDLPAETVWPPAQSAVFTSMPQNSVPAIRTTPQILRPTPPTNSSQNSELYQVWQMIAPQSGLQVLKFELHRPEKNRPWPEKIVTITILVP